MLLDLKNNACLTMYKKNGYNIHYHVHIQPQTEDTSDSDSLPAVSITPSPTPPKKGITPIIQYQHKNIILLFLCISNRL